VFGFLYTSLNLQCQDSCHHIWEHYKTCYVYIMSREYRGCGHKTHPTMLNSSHLLQITRNSYTCSPSPPLVFHYWNAIYAICNLYYNACNLAKEITYGIKSFEKGRNTLFSQPHSSDINMQIYCFTAQVLKVSRTPGPTVCSKTKV